MIHLKNKLTGFCLSRHNIYCVFWLNLLKRQHNLAPTIPDYIMTIMYIDYGISKVFNCIWVVFITSPWWGKYVSKRDSKATLLLFLVPPQACMVTNVLTDNKKVKLLNWVKYSNWPYFIVNVDVVNVEYIFIMESCMLHYLARSDPLAADLR